MVWWGEEAAKAAKIAVWWDMKDCPIPKHYNARRVRPSLEAAFKKLGYSGPVSITAYGDQTLTRVPLFRDLYITGVAVAHTRSESTCALMYWDMVEWRRNNPPPATMMIISDQVKGIFAWDLARLQQRTRYNLFQAYSIESQFMSVLSTRAEWLWEELLLQETRSAPLLQGKCSEMDESSAMLSCKSCNVNAQSPENFRKHLWSYNHARKEAIDPTSTPLECATVTWGRNYQATPEYATAKIKVWWDMSDCRIPEGYDARRVRPSLEAAFKNLGYSGPVSITAFDDLKHIPDHVLRGLSSTGVDVAHTIYHYTKHIYFDILDWQDSNPPPSTIMVIMDNLDPVFSSCLATLLQDHKHNLFLAYLYRPRKMSALLSSAEWLWESLLAVSETTRHFLQKCSESESDRGESTSVFYCKLCFCDCKGLDDFRTHLSSEEHVQEEYRITTSIENNRKEKILSHSAQYDRNQLREALKDKRMRKTFRTGFHLLDYHLRRRRARRKSQTSKKEYW